VSTYKDYTVTVDPDRFGLGRDEVMWALKADGVDTRHYFSPPVHRQKAYLDVAPVELPVTEAVTARVLSLPIFGDLGLDAVAQVVAVLRSVHDHAEQIAEQVPAVS
jgi:dTDP-4-amino-4,6-dideoxygalactose transaminase